MELEAEMATDFVVQLEYAEYLVSWKMRTGDFLVHLGSWKMRTGDFVVQL